MEKNPMLTPMALECPREGAAIRDRAGFFEGGRVSATPGFPRAVTRLALAFLGLTLLSAGGFAAPREDLKSAKRYAVIDSGAWISENSPFVWLDNQRIVFITSESMRSDVTRPARAIWSPGTPPRIDWKYAENLWCFDGKTLGFWQRIGAQKSWFKGPIGEEKPWEFSICRRPMGAFRRPFMTGGSCECRDKLDGPWKTRRSELLMEGHGWLDLGADRGSNADLANVPVFYRRPPLDPVLMPFRSREVGPITYHPFKGAYFIQGDYFNAEKGIQQSPHPMSIPQLAWWLYSDGRVLDVVIPVAASQHLRRGYGRVRFQRNVGWR